MSLGTERTERPRRYIRFTAAVGIVLDLCVCTGAAWSQQSTSGHNQALRQACAPDYHALCSGTRPGGGRIAACFEQNAAKLSDQCRSALQAAKPARQQAN
jgi:hypothetical protein